MSIALLAACATTTEVEELPSAEGYYQRALEMLEGRKVLFLFTDVDYDGAILLLQEVIDNYPYSEYATLAELKIADVHFDREQYEEAESFYQDFVELHPNHARVPYALYRNGLCSYEQVGGVDQDQSETREAVSEFEVLLERYPGSAEAGLAQVLLGEVRDGLAQHDVDVGDFYFGRNEFPAAIGRYRRALSSWPTHENNQRTRARLAVALLHMRRYGEAEALLHQVLNEDPDDDVHDLVQAKLEEIRTGRANRGPRPLQRSCATDPNPACAAVDLP